MSGQIRMRAVWALVAILAFISAFSAGAQEAVRSDPPSGPVAEQRDAAPASAGSEEDRARLAEVEAEISRLRADADEWAARSAAYKQARQDAPEHLRTIELEIEAIQGHEGGFVDEDAEIEELETQLLGAEQDLSLARNEAAALEAESAQRYDRRKRIPELLVAAKERLSQMGDEPVVPATGDPAVFEARQRLGQARRFALEREIEAYELELVSFEARGQTLHKRLDRGALRVAHQEARVEALRKAVTTRLQAEAERSAERARESLAQAAALPDAVQSFAQRLSQENSQLAEQRTGENGLLGRIDEVRGKLSRVEEHLAKLDADFQRLVRKVEATGLNDSVGLLLRKQRSEVPDVGKYRRFIRMRQELISAVQVEQIERRQQRRKLAGIDQIIEQAMTQVDASVSDEDRARIEVVLRDLLQTKREYLDLLIGEYETYFQKLVDFDARQQELIEKTKGLLLYIDERVLWIPSGEAVRPTLLADGLDGLAWLLSPRFAAQLLRALGSVAIGAPLLNALIVLLIILSVPLKRRLRIRLASLAEETRKPTCTRDGPTWEAFGLTLLLAPWWPGLVGYLGWRLSISPDATQYVRCIAHGLLCAALIWISLEVPRQILRKDGIGEAHFGWPNQAVRSLRRYLTWLTALVVPAVFLIQLFELRGEDLWRDSIGRLAFLAIMFAAALFSHWAMREPLGALWGIAQQSPDLSIRRWVWRLCHGFAVGTALLLATAAFRGYYWTSLKLAVSYHATLVFLFLLLVVFWLCARWSMLARRRIALERFQRAREASDAAAGEDETAEPAVDLASIDTQTSRLLNSATLVVFLIGLWGIWADLLPAVGILREIELWSTTGSVTVETIDAAGGRRFAVEDRVLPVTLADLFLSLIIGLMTLVTVRNLPGLLEITVFRQLGTGSGERYAYATIAKYGITMVGVALAFGAVGVGWSNIQWLVAAVGLGLGFGLQEIFANFVSGLIILFERPIRVGDTVTVGDVSGVVSRVRIRATWITGFDRKELVVPNKEFVTTRLINWSLSDAVLRVEIRVGIAYGSDTEKAIEVLRAVAAANEHVLREPEPEVLFRGFGDSALDFELRVFSPDVEHRLRILHELHMAIDRAFREEGIEIAFPQRDVHVRTVPQVGSA